MVVFEGSAPVRIEDAVGIHNATSDFGPQIWLGEPVAIRGPVGLPEASRRREPPAGWATTRTRNGPDRGHDRILSPHPP